MKPVRDLDYKLVDILNALLDTGVVINADVVISVSGIPLIGINLRAALAGMATMLDYGLMEAWDESIRKYYAKEIEERNLSMLKNKKIEMASGIVSNQRNLSDKLIQPSLSDVEIILKEKLWFLSSASDIIGETWLPGYMYVTDKRVYWSYHLDGNTLFDIPVKNVISIEVDETKPYITRIPNKHKIFKISYRDSGNKEIASFSGEELKIKRIKSAIENTNNNLLNHI